MDEREVEVRRRIAAHEVYVDYGPGLDDLAEERVAGKERAAAFNATGHRDVEGRERLVRELFGSVGEGTWVEPPVYVAYGRHVHLGAGVYVNVGLTVVDDGEIHIGDHVMIAPNVTISTTGHPLHPDARRDGSQFSAPVRIEADVWIGASVTIVPGVTIGKGSVVGAGSVVTRDVPPGVVVVGVPARILRPITEDDREFRYSPPRSL